MACYVLLVTVDDFYTNGVFFFCPALAPMSATPAAGSSVGPFNGPTDLVLLKSNGRRVETLHKIDCFLDLPKNDKYYGIELP